MDKRQFDKQLESMRNNTSKQVRAYMGWIPWMDGYFIYDHLREFKIPVYAHTSLIDPKEHAAIAANDIIRNIMRVV